MHPRGPRGELPAPTLAGAGGVQVLRRLHVAEVVVGAAVLERGVFLVLPGGCERRCRKHTHTRRTHGEGAWQSGHLTNWWTVREKDSEVQMQYEGWFACMVSTATRA